MPASEQHEPPPTLHVLVQEGNLAAAFHPELCEIVLFQAVFPAFQYLLAVLHRPMFDRSAPYRSEELAPIGQDHLESLLAGGSAVRFYHGYKDYICSLFEQAAALF